MSVKKQVKRKHISWVCASSPHRPPSAVQRLSKFVFFVLLSLSFEWVTKKNYGLNFAKKGVEINHMCKNTHWAKCQRSRQPTLWSVWHRMCKSAATASEESSAGAQCRHVDGWVQYYEYFHKLDEDMQAHAIRASQCLRALSLCLPSLSRIAHLLLFCPSLRS